MKDAIDASIKKHLGNGDFKAIFEKHVGEDLSPASKLLGTAFLEARKSPAFQDFRRRVVVDVSAAFPALMREYDGMLR